MDSQTDLDRVAVLAEPTRRRVHELLRQAARPLGRKEVAGALDLPENLASFHLDRLAEAGAVRVIAAERTPGQRGRPARRYEVDAQEVTVSLPPRRYDLMAELLAVAAREQRPGTGFQASAEQVARSYGRELGEQAAGHETGRRRSPLARVVALLGDLGYAPRRTGRAVVLDNCPFHRLRATNTPLVCGVNVALADGCVTGLGAQDDVTARLDPDPDRCCVVLTRPSA